MGEVKRYRPIDLMDAGQAYGKVVLASDYATLEAENAKLRAEMERWESGEWKLVPVEPTPEMLDAAIQDGICVDGKPVWKKGCGVPSQMEIPTNARRHHLRQPEGEVQRLKIALRLSANRFDRLALEFPNASDMRWTASEWANEARAAIAAARKGEGE